MQKHEDVMIFTKVRDNATLLVQVKNSTSQVSDTEENKVLQLGSGRHVAGGCKAWLCAAC